MQLSKEICKVLEDLLVGIKHEDSPIIEEFGKRYIKYDSIKFTKGFFSGWKIRFLWKGVEVFMLDAPDSQSEMTIMGIQGRHPWSITPTSCVKSPQ
jgi:hypothetical protein